MKNKTSLNKGKERFRSRAPSQSITVKAYLKSLDPFQLHLHFASTTPPSTMCSGSTLFCLAKHDHTISQEKKCRRHHVLANSRCLWSPRSLLFAQAVVNMELQVVSKQLLPTQQMCIHVCMWFFRARTLSAASSLSCHLVSHLHRHVC